MNWNDWLSIIAIVFSIVAFMFSWKWSTDSSRSLDEIRRVAEQINQSVDLRTRDIEKKVEDRTREIERSVDSKTDKIATAIETRVSDLIKRAAPTDEDKAFGNILNQVGPQMFQAIMTNPDMLKMIMENNKKD
ncbi:hypothetical protein C1I60_22545 [Paenibacillus terrae]|uniref:DUF948 domain-containing protein n=1 Tax=Paenibacillus terrae TaxID=159743 RepID=A0A4U2PTW3_9BACL|nr:hypothetical protein [Paenibacillus terrae]TKH42079.1 hypothetical protein C1I60_22545 [Paenibacillus terrae]